MKGIRDIISILDHSSILSRLKNQVDIYHEIGSITKMNSTPLLFENIEDYPGFQLVTNILCDYSKIALVLGMDVSTHDQKLLRVFQQRVSETVDPVMIEKGSVEENVLLGDDVDLFKLPAPWWNIADGGRYIGTWHLNVSKDPDTGIRNIGVYRMMVLDSTHTTISVSPKSHLAYHVQKAKSCGRHLEMAVAIGVNEALVIVAASAFPFGVDEYTKSGALCEKPVELIKCKTVDLEVPAHAEIVLEGLIDPGIRVTDGPFLDYAGIPNTNYNAYRFEVTCIMHRNDPIFRGAVVGYPGAEDHILYSFLSQCHLVDFHGSKMRQKVQNYLLQKQAFRAFQLSGRATQFLSKFFRR